MDKRTLQLFVGMIIPAIGFAYTLVYPQFNTPAAQKTMFIAQFNVRVFIVLICTAISTIAIGLLFAKKYVTINSLQDQRDEIYLNEITDIVEKYMKQFHPNEYATTSRSEIKEKISKTIKITN